MGMSRPSYGRGQGSFFGRRPPPMRNPRMPMPPMNQPQMPSGGGFLAQLGSSPMMQRPMPGGPGKGRLRGRPMPGGPGKGRGQIQQPMPARPSFDQRMTQGPMNMPRPTLRTEVGPGMPQTINMLPMNFPQPAPPNNPIIGRPMPQQSFMGRVGNNMPRLQRPLPSNMRYGMGFYSGGITDLY